MRASRDILKYILLSCTGLLLAAPSLAAAQATPSAQPAEDVSALGEIVVTALRSNLTIQETPAAVTAIGGEDLDRALVDDVRGLQVLVPATRFSASYTSTRIFIRGVGSLLDFYWIPELTASNFNGVYLPRYSINGAMFDIDNVQVLPGPQGVLYGRSAGGGVLLINAKRPTQEAEASGSLEYGNYNLIRAEAMGNIPVTEDLAVRLAATTTKRDGYQSLDMMSDDSFAARVSALYRPTEDLSLYGWVMHAKQDGNPVGTQYIPYSGDPWFVPVRDSLSGISNLGGFTDFDYTIAGYEASFALGSATVTYRGSVLNQTEQSLSKLSGNNRTVDNAQIQYTQDLSVSGELGALDFIAGVNWLTSDSDHDVRFGVAQNGTIFDGIDQDSVSLFGHGSYELTPSLRLVGGARWSRDSLDLDGTGISCNPICNRPPITFSKDWEHVDVKAGAEYDLGEDVLLYANVQTGYAPGTLNTFTNVVTVSKEIRPQTLLAYTAGFKSQFAEKRYTVNVEAYHYSYEDLIIQSFNSTVGAQSLFNVPEATIYGAQVTGSARLWEGGTISGNVAYTHARYGAFRTTPAARNLDGLQMQFAPDWTGTVAYDHRFELGSGARIDTRVSTYFSSSYWGTFDHSGNARQDGFTKSDASVTYTAPDERWYAGLWVRNIEDQDVRTAISALSPPGAFTAATFLEPPRTYGLKIGFNY